LAESHYNLALILMDHFNGDNEAKTHFEIIIKCTNQNLQIDPNLFYHIA